MYPGNVTVTVTDIQKLENAIVEGDLIIVGKLEDSLTFSNIKVLGDLDVSGTGTDRYDFEGIEISGDTIL